MQLELDCVEVKFFEHAFEANLVSFRLGEAIYLVGPDGSENRITAVSRFT